MKRLLLILLIFNSIRLFSQEKVKKFNYQFGGGISLNLMSGFFMTFENEINYKINNYFTSSIYFDFGKDIYKELFPYQENKAYLQGGINIFLSPFKNNKNNNLKIGTGFSYTDVNIYRYYLKKEMKYSNKINSNIILEYNYLIKDNYLIGTKIFMNTFFFRHLYYADKGILLKLGIIL